MRRDPSGPVELLPILLAGTVSAFLLAMRGKTVLHASAVAIDRCRRSRSSASPAAASRRSPRCCASEGAQLVTDDVLVVELGPPVTCIGGASELRLRPAAAPLTETTPDAQTRRTADDRVALSAPPAPTDPLPLSSIVIPAPSRTASKLEVRRLPPSTAVFWLLSFPRVHGWSVPDVLRRDFSTLSELVNRVPVYDVTIPWGPPFDPDVVRELAALAVSPAVT